MLIKLTNHKNETILIGIESIIAIEPFSSNSEGYRNTSSKIKSRGAMVDIFYVKETVEEIYKLTKSIDIQELNNKIHNLEEQLKVAKEMYFKK